MIYLDSDGVFADWRGYVSEHHLRDMSFEDFNRLPEERRRAMMRKIYQNDPNLFYNLKPIAGTERILEAVEKTGECWAILTSGSEDHPDHELVTKSKELFFEKHFGLPKDRIIVTASSKEKQQYSGKGKLLIDDYRRNCNEWVLYGGSAIWTKTGEPNIPRIITHIEDMWSEANQYYDGSIVLCQ